MSQKQAEKPILENTAGSFDGLSLCRPDTSDKGDFGCAAVMGGCASYVGAPQFAAHSAAVTICAVGQCAMLAGAGTSILAIPDFLASAVYSNVLYSAVYPLPSGNGVIKYSQADADLLISKVSAFALGPGSGGGDTDLYILRILEKGGQPLVVDADALKKSSYIPDLAGRAILTPHMGEMSALTGVSVSSIKENAAEICRGYAEYKNAVVALKGDVSYISDGNLIYRNTTGNARLAKGGSGDVLSGIIAGLLAWKIPAIDAARLGCYILGRAAELSEVNVISHLPTDLMYCIPKAFDELTERKNKF